MAQRCELTGKGPMVKNLVSHSNIKTKKWVKPNTRKRRIFSETLSAMVVLRVSNSALRSIDHAGGFDAFILHQGDAVLSTRARGIRERIRSARG